MDSRRPHRPPRDNVELVVRRIWLDVLDIPQLSIDETFFDVGGSSLAAIRVLDAVKREFGVKLPFEALLTDATVEHMARAIRDGYNGSPKSLMAIRPGSRLPVLVCVHHVGGDLEAYHDLIDALPKSVPCLGLKSLGLDSRCKPHRDVPAMAAHYLDELTRKYDPNEIVVAGYSLGGLVAFEMACQMDERATPLRGMMLLDAIVPEQPYSPTPPTAPLRMLVEDVLRLELDVDELATLPADTLRATILDAAEQTGSLPASYGQDRLQRMIEVIDSNYKAAARYLPPNYRRPAHLVTVASAEGRKHNTDAWRSHCSAGLEVYDIGSSHADVLSGTYATEVAEVFWKLWWEQ
jgi:thioesterase domain-containing protein/acyl carrier protein